MGDDSICRMKLDGNVVLPVAALAPRIRRLLKRGATEEELVEAAAVRLPELFFALEMLRRRNALHYLLVHRGELLATVRPLRAGFSLEETKAGVRGRTQLSRFACLRPDGTGMVMESPLSPVQIRLERTAIALLGKLGSQEDGASDLALLLRRTGMLAGAEETPYRYWEFHDLLFHAASRLGRQTVGGTYRFVKTEAAPPALKPPMGEVRIALAAPDMSLAAERDERLIRVMEDRRSRRGPGVRAITLEQTGEFLFRTVRNCAVEAGSRQELLRRPMPGGGAIHELEFYLCVHRCQGLASGMYHYHGGEHALYRLPAPETAVRKLLQRAGQAWGNHGTPDILIIFASRFARIAWKYEGMAYRTTLLNAGVAMQTMYLAATAMGLSGCANGNGDPALFAEASGLSPAEETSVGEFALSGDAA